MGGDEFFVSFMRISSSAKTKLNTSERGRPLEIYATISSLIRELEVDVNLKI